MANPSQFFQRLTRKDRNPYNLESEEQEFTIARIAQSLLGFTGIDYYLIRDALVEATYNDYLKSVPTKEVLAESDLLSATPWNVMLVNYNQGIHIVTEKERKAGSFVMPCYGELINPNGVTLDNRMIKTCMGLILDSRKYASLWIFAMESCQPNVKVEQKIVKGENGVLKFICYLSALTDIQMGDVLRIHPGDLRMDGEYKFDCKCQQPQCIAGESPTWSCSVPNCHRIGKPFKNKAALTTHERKYHAIPDGISPPKTTFPCDLCNTVCSTAAILHRHRKSKHFGQGQTECKWCGRVFARLESYKRHFLANKYGCKGIANSQQKKNGTLIGPSKVILKNKLEHEGYYVVKKCHERLIPKPVIPQGRVVSQ